ncbi:MAG: hypothetical protein WC489_06150 [Patescibacteria group bacterium]
MKVNWMPNNTAARQFREPDKAPGIVFRYVGAWTRKDEAEKATNKIKRKGNWYRTQYRPGPGTRGWVYVVFEGVPK